MPHSPAPNTLATQWRRQEHAAKSPFFQTWDWLGTWHALTSAEAAPEPLILEADGKTNGLAFLCHQRVTRHRVLGVNRVILNETGRPTFDGLTLEYNGLVAADSDREAAFTAFIDTLAQDTRWDEAQFSGLAPVEYDLLTRLCAEQGWYPWIVDEKPCDYVDLAAIRAAGKGYEASLSRNTRYQIRRARKLYGGEDSVKLVAAKTTEEALAFFEEMRAPHQVYWNARGQSGAYANPFFVTFHKELIARCFDNGTIDLLRCEADGQLIGYLYNFVSHGCVYAYQSGFDYSEDPKVKPGLVTHCAAINHYLDAGCGRYEFMAGEAQHKKSLGTDRYMMTWLVAQRPRLRLQAERLLRQWRARMRDRRAAAESN
ncbi:MAG: GNAT family N-acetyltransferase [Magnetospiraceae bacterium]